VKVLTHFVPKAFEFTKMRPNTRKIGPGRLAKVLPTFQKKILRQKHICRIKKQARMPWQFSKALDVCNSEKSVIQ
jgi:hypothetical protein